MGVFDTFSDGDNRFLEILDKFADAATTAANAYAEKSRIPNYIVNVNKSAETGTNISSEIATHISRMLRTASKVQDR